MRERGVPSMWKGISSSLVEKLPSNVSMIFFHTVVKSMLGDEEGDERKSFLKEMIVGSTAGAFCSLTTHPLFVVASYAQQRARYNYYPIHYVKCFNLLIKQYGLKSLYHRNTLALIQYMIFGGVYFGLKNILLDVEYRSGLGLCDLLIFRFASQYFMTYTNLIPIVFVNYPLTAAATVLSYPLNVLKVQLLYNYHYLGRSTPAYVVAKDIYKQEGFMGFYKALPLELVESLSFAVFIHYISRFSVLIRRVMTSIITSSPPQFEDHTLVEEDNDEGANSDETIIGGSTRQVVVVINVWWP